MSGNFEGGFDIVSKCIGIRPTIRLAAKPHMADFTAWGYTAAEFAGLGGATLMAAYARNIYWQYDEAVAFSDSGVGQLVVTFMVDRPEWLESKP